MYIEGILTLIGGLYCSLLAFGVVSPGRSKKEKRKFLESKSARIMRVAGPILFIISLLRLIMASVGK